MKDKNLKLKRKVLELCDVDIAVLFGMAKVVFSEKHWKSLIAEIRRYDVHSMYLETLFDEGVDVEKCLSRLERENITDKRRLYLPK